MVQILDQQLLKNNWVVSVNGKTDLHEMLPELSEVKAEWYHL